MKEGRGKGEVGEKISNPVITTTGLGQTNGTAISETKLDEWTLHDCLTNFTRYSKVHQLHFLTALLSRQPSPHSKTNTTDQPSKDAHTHSMSCTLTAAASGEGGNQTHPSFT